MDTLRVRLFGTLEIEGMDPGELGRRQVRSLLRMLALDAGRPVSVETLVGWMWGALPPVRAAEQIGVLVSRLRACVGADRVGRSDAGYALHADWTDVAALEEYAREAQRRLDGRALSAARAAASAGLALLRGPLLADEPDAWWAEPARARADALAGQLAETGARAAMTARDWVGAAAMAQLAALRRPHDEALLRIQMEALARAGRAAAALGAFADARARLRDDLGVSPSPDTEALHTTILHGRLPAAEPATAIRRTLPGRESVLAALDLLLDRAEQGRGRVCMVEGEAGIGKSSLLAAFSVRATSRSAMVVAVAATDLGAALPLQPLLDVLDALLRDRGRGSDPLGDDGSLLGPLLASQHEPAPPAQLATLTDHGTGRALLFAAIVSVLRRAAERAPLVVLVDDVHFADAATMAWLAYADLRIRDAGVVIVAARRVEEGTAVPGLPVVELGPLDADAAAEIVGADRAVALHARSGGHPLFLVELAAADPTGQLPKSIRASVEERCARSGPAAATLQAAAVIGATVDLDVLASVTGTAAGTLLDHLEEGVRRRFLVEAGPSFQFRHLLVREALAATVSGSRAAYVHRETGRALAARPVVDPMAVAHHARLGGDVGLASEMLVRAARMAVLRFDPAEALGLLDEAIALDDTATARLERARIRSMTGAYAGADGDVAAARRLGSTADALEVAAWSAHFQRRFDDALRLADEGAAAAVDGDLRTSCLALGGWVSLVSGDLDGATVRLTAATDDPLAPSRPLAEAWLGFLMLNRGRPEETLRLVGAEAEGGLASYRYPTAYALMARAMAAAMAGRPDAALAAIAALESEVARVGARRWQPRSHNLRGWILRNVGAAGAADEQTRAAIEQARAADLAEPLANGLLDLASGRLQVDDLDGAAELLMTEDPVGGVEHAFRWRTELRRRLLQARLALATGAVEQAQAAARGVCAEARRLGVPRYEVQADLVLAIAEHRQGAPADADRVEQRLGQLGRVAGLEAWWITAEVARAFDAPRWRALARQRASALLDMAGEHRSALEAAADHRIG
jgi:DNA-binding SARP family transcriptional activator